jgi:E3 ubiquitin-protein ligase synoviolin
MINLFEMWTLSNFESKSTIFTVIDFVSTILVLFVNTYMCIYVTNKIGYFPIYVFRDLLLNIWLFYISCKSFVNTISMTIKLKKLPTVQGKDLDESNDVCLVCFSKIEEGKLIGCGHAYHYNCIKTWIEKDNKKECPKCRRKINLDE